MTYTVTSTSGAAIATIPDGTVNTSATSLALIGKNYAGYGIFLNENYIQLLENFSNSTPPTAPLTGQLWYDNVNDILKVYNSDTNQWKPISSSIAQGTAPSSSISVTGDIWWDTTNAQLKVWSGSAWVTIGPAYTSTSGTSGPVTETILDTPSGSPHVVTKFFISSSVIAILSKDPAFSPQTTIPGFTTIYPGFNLISPSTLTGVKFTGPTESASTLGGFTASQFIKNTEAQVTNYAFTAAGGLTVGSDLTFDSSSPTESVISQTTSNKNIRVNVNRSGSPTQAVLIAASTNTVTLSGNLAVTGVTTHTGATTFNGQISLGATVLPTANVSYNIGSTSSRLNQVWSQSFYGGTFYGTAVTAQYADLAERFEADAEYPAGTVVALGGTKEITAAVDELTEDVFGVISAKAAFLMNGSAGNDITHPAVAVNGRVPVRVIGTVRKGDRLVSAGNGLARAASKSEYTAFNVIGRALEDKLTSKEGTIEAIVKLNS